MLPLTAMMTTSFDVIDIALSLLLQLKLYGTEGSAFFNCCGELL